MKTTDTSLHSNKIAIIGMSCRMPGAENIHQFWENLVNEVDSITQFTDEELRESGIDESLINSPNYVKARGIIGGASKFDAAFFNITPRDAEIMDPQHRIFLECAWHALEDGGYDPAKSDARVAVYGGTGVGWHLNSVTNNPDSARYASGTSIVTGNDKDYLATRVSYKLNLTGPSFTVQSACSTSMVAVVMGINSLLSYQCDLVLAGGSTIEMPEKQGYLYHEGGLDSSDGKCHTFDKDADGTVFSRGTAVVLLKRYEDAVADGDHIYAVILSGAVNNDGNNKVGYTAPSVQGQADVAIEACELAGISAETIGYVEAHGTGTSVGDPIEVSSLSQCFRSYTDKKQFCAIGSVKTNIGHTDSASGVAGIIKVAMSLLHKKIPAHLHYKEPNPKIDFPNSPFFVNTSTKDWEAANHPRRALINSFGVGGTNACVILEEPPVLESATPSGKLNILMLSARSDQALENTRENLHDFVGKNPTLNLDDLAYTYQVGRRGFNNRGFLSFKNREDLLDKLSREGTLQKGICEEENKPLIFMFPGQGNQYPRMGAELYADNPQFRETVDYCAEYLKSHFGFDLRSYLYEEKDLEKAKAALEQTRITQPAIFIVSYAMAKVLMGQGLKPEAYIGHSVGEYVAACLAGVMSLEDALKAVATRGALIQDLPGGSMLAVLQNEDKILPFLFPGVEVAAVNNPGLTVVAGSDENIEKLENSLNARGYFSKRLSTSHAFHSEMMEPCLPTFAQFFKEIKLSAPSTPIISTVTGKFLTAEEAVNPEYWVSHVRRTVRFTDAVLSCLEMNPSVFLEVGPGQSLESAVKRHLDKDSKHAAVRSMKTESETTNDNVFLAAALGNLWLSGAEIPWSEFYRGQERKRISLPGYPFEREEYSIDFSKVNSGKAAKTNKRYKDSKDWYSVPVWKRSADIKYLVHANGEIQTWLLIQDQSGLGYEVANRLLDMGQNVYEVYAGSSFLKKSENKYSIDISKKEHYELLVQDLVENNVDVTHVIHLLNYSDKTSSELGMETFDEIEAKAFFSPMFLQQALYNANKLKEVQFSIVGNGAFNVIGEPVYAPEKALCIGPARVLIQEFPMARSRYIDVDIQPDEKQRARLAEKIVAETRNKKYETLVAYRNHYRWLEGYDLVPLEDTGKPVYKDQGVYLITGGLGGIGILTARAIAAEVKATFILTYNSEFPERSEWDAWLAENSEDGYTRSKIQGVRELISMGAEVIEKRVNVSNYVEMKQLVEEVERTVGKIDGVIHSAGAAGGGVLPLKSAESCRPVLDSKFRGVAVLHKVFAGRELDFFVLYSSVAAILGEATRIDYCSGNAFIDAFANHRKSVLHDHSMSINWAGWKEVGMAVRWEMEKLERANKLKAKGEPSLVSPHAHLAENTILRPSSEFLVLHSKIGEDYIFDVDYKPAHDWIINTHFVVNQPTVVGTSFIEVLHQFGKIALPGQQMELKNLFFIAPMMFEGGRNKKVRLFVEWKKDKYKFSFKSQLLEKDEAKDMWHDHLVGEIAVASGKPGNLDIQQLTSRLNDRIDETKPPRILYNAANMAIVDLGERWEVENYIHCGKGEWLAKMTLPSKFASDAEDFDFHPALLDRATSYAFWYVGGGPYLPFSYGSVTPYAKVPHEVYVYAKLSEQQAQSNDTVSIDLAVTDLDGNVLMDIKGYTMKQVNNQLSAPSANGVSDGDKATAKLLSNTIDYIDPDQGEEVIRHILNCEFPEQLVVYPCDFDFMLEDNLPDLQKREEEKEKQRREKKSYYLRPALSTPYVEPANEMEKTIAEIWQDILGLDKVGRDDTFTDLGGNSLLAIQTIANIADVLEVELSAQAFYENPTVKGLAEVVVSSIMGMDDMENLEGIIESMGLKD